MSATFVPKSARIDCPEIFPKVCQSKEAANIDFIIFAFRDAYENFLELLRLEEELSADIETLKKYLYSIYSNLTKLVSLRQHGDIQSVDLNVLEAGIDQCRGGLGLGANLSTTVNSKGHDILSEILQAVLVQTEFTRDSIAQVQGDESVKLNLSGTYQKMNLPQKATKEYSYNVAVDWNFILQRLYGSASPYEKEIAPEETLRSRFYRHAMEWKCRLQSRNEQEEQRQAYTDLEKFQTEFLSLIDVLEPATEELLIDRARTTGSWSPLKRLAVSAGFVKTPWNLYHINDVLGSFEGLFTSIENASDLIQPFRDMWTKSLAIDANLNTALEELSKAGGSLDALGEEGHQQLESLFQLFDTNARTLREAIVEPE